ncbi:Protein SLOW WALKER 1 [Hibiscus syriacus]|uniref:Protein SLOW WALKER 1 n=1 Tax=Hibiscus syriacus TaxID=106335 RepID=A0A6A2Y3T6_HIBSY|nr:Protein SLOW WALKER 1 [Hibiscus syriacus]
MAEIRAEEQTSTISKTFLIKPKLKPKPRTLPQTPESKYWSSFKSTQIPNLVSSISSLSFSPSPPHTPPPFHSSPRPPSPAATFHIPPSSPPSRRRFFSFLPRPVRFVKYPVLDKLHLLFGGDDAVIKFWDVAGESVVLDLMGHKDYVRCGDCSPVSSDLFVTGSYDHTVKVWDVRVENSKSVLEVNHGKPVEDVIYLPSGGLIATAGGNSVKIWDLIGGGRMSDRNIEWDHICREKEREGERGEWRKGKRFSFEIVSEPERQVLRPTYFRYFHRGQSEKPAEGDYLVMRNKKIKLAEHDKLLKKFRHKDGLVSVLNKRNRENVIAVMEELVTRKKLLKCVSNLDADELGLLLMFLSKNATMPRYFSLLMGLTKKVIEIRAEDIRTSDALKGHIRNLKQSIEEELRIQHSLQEIRVVTMSSKLIFGGDAAHWKTVNSTGRCRAKLNTRIRRSPPEREIVGSSPTVNILNRNGDVLVLELFANISGIAIICSVKSGDSDFFHSVVYGCMKLKKGKAYGLDLQQQVSRGIGSCPWLIAGDFNVSIDPKESSQF